MQKGVNYLLGITITVTI